MHEVSAFTITYTDGANETFTPTIVDVFKAGRTMKQEHAGKFGEDDVETAMYLAYTAHVRVSGDTRPFEEWLETVQNFTNDESEEAPKAL